MLNYGLVPLTNLYRYPAISFYINIVNLLVCILVEFRKLPYSLLFCRCLCFATNGCFMFGSRFRGQ